MYPAGVFVVVGVAQVSEYIPVSSEYRWVYTEYMDHRYGPLDIPFVFRVNRQHLDMIDNARGQTSRATLIRALIETLDPVPPRIQDHDVPLPLDVPSRPTPPHKTIDKPKLATPEHAFKPQTRNALKCDICGMKKAAH